MITIFGLSYEVYLINIIIAIPTFFVIRWLFKKIIKDKKIRLITTWAGTISLTPLIYIASIILMFTILTQESIRDFNRERWFSHIELRYEMRDDIVESEIQIIPPEAE